MRYRRLGRTGLEVSEIGFGAWALGGNFWGGQDDAVSFDALSRAVELGVNFIDTALVYGYGRSERVIGEFLRVSALRNKILIATKIPPMNYHWPAAPDTSIDQVFPAHHIKTSVNESLRNLRLETIDLMQLHVWTDAFTDDDAWWEMLQALKTAGKIRFVGISINSFEPNSVLRALEKGRADVVQVHYNVFEQRPQDELFAAAEKSGAGLIARVPLEESALTGKLTPRTRFPAGDFRAVYFQGERLQQVVQRVEAVRPLLVSAAGSMVAGALRFCLSDPRISTVIPGIRSRAQADDNIGASDAGPLDAETLSKLRTHRWDRPPSEWV